MGQVGQNNINRATLWWAGPLTVVVSVLLVFVGCAMWSAQPISLYRRIALGALALSMIPDALLPGNVPGATWPAAFVLMVAHVAAWAPTVFVLTNRALVANRV